MSLLATLALTGSAAAAPLDGFPPDPKGGAIIDRLYQVVPLAGKEYSLYAAAWKPDGKKPTEVTIYSGTESRQGMEWKKLYTWVLSDGSQPFDVSHSVLMVAPNSTDEIQFWFKDFFKYVEGRGVLVLHYYPKTGKFEWQVAD